MNKETPTIPHSSLYIGLIIATFSLYIAISGLIDIKNDIYRYYEASLETKTVTVEDISVDFKNYSYEIIVYLEGYEEPIYLGQVGDAKKVRDGDIITISGIFEDNTIRYINDVKIQEKSR